MHHSLSLPNVQTSFFFKQSFTKSIFFFHSQPTKRLLTYPFSNPIISHSFNMAKPSENTFINSSIHPLHHSTELSYPCFAVYFLMPIKPVRLSIYTALLLDLSFSSISLSHYHTIKQEGGMPYPASSNTKECIFLAFTRDLIAPTTFLPLTNYLQHFTLFLLDSSKTNQTYLN